MMNHSRLRQALSVPPADYVLPKPTSVPTVITIEEILTRAQNRLRVIAHETLLKRIFRWVWE